MCSNSNVLLVDEVRCLEISNKLTVMRPWNVAISTRPSFPAGDAERDLCWSRTETKYTYAQ